MVKLSIVIPSLNQEAPIGRAIQQFWSPERPDVEVIVADAGSLDGTRSVARLLADQIVDVGGPAEPWKAQAKNAGAAAAKGDVVLFVEPEARILTSLKATLEKMNKLFGNGRRIVCAVPQVELLDAEAVGAETGQFGQMLAVKRAAFLECGGFDEALARDEDAELLQRIAKHGLVESVQDLKFVVAPQPKPEEVLA
jgi:glycosyltransferase involved in cell wall biosynthesis